MIVAGLLGFLLTAPPPQAVPGLCTEPASGNVGRPGCYLAAELRIERAPAAAYWRIVEVETADEARRLASSLQSSRSVEAHGRHWVLAIETEQTGGDGVVIGPLDLPADRPVAIRFLESWFTPGMITRAHAHPGAEVFYVIEGEQCVETPTAQARIGPGEHFTVADGPHLQAAPNGRRSLVALIVPEGSEWMSLTPDWTPSGYCAS